MEASLDKETKLGVDWSWTHSLGGGNKGTASRVRVLIESGDQKEKWGTVGVSENIMEASWQALADSIEYKMLAEDPSDKSST